MPHRRALLARLAVVVRGLSFRESDGPKDRVSGAAVVAVLCALVEGSDQPAARITDRYSVRVVSRALAFLRSTGLILEESFRANGSPRVRRSIQWDQLAAWIDSPTEAHQRTRISAEIAVTLPGDLPAEDADEPTAPERMADGGWLMAFGQQVEPAGDAAHREREGLRRDLATLGVSPEAVEKSPLPLAKQRQLVQHYEQSALTDEAGNTVYAWLAGLLYQRLVRPDLATLAPTDWPPSRDDHWKRLKARAVNAARLKREAEDRARSESRSTAENPADRLHQLELRFPGQLTSVGEVIRRLRSMPQPSDILIRRVKASGLENTAVRFAVLSEFAKSEGA
jgi:hypothetical protein